MVTYWYINCLVSYIFLGFGWSEYAVIPMQETPNLANVGQFQDFNDVRSLFAFSVSCQHLQLYPCFVFAIFLGLKLRWL